MFTMCEDFSCRRFPIVIHVVFLEITWKLSKIVNLKSIMYMQDSSLLECTQCGDMHWMSAYLLCTWIHCQKKDRMARVKRPQSLWGESSPTTPSMRQLSIRGHRQAPVAMHWSSRMLGASQQMHKLLRRPLVSTCQPSSTEWKVSCCRSEIHRPQMWHIWHQWDLGDECLQPWILECPAQMRMTAVLLEGVS